MDNSAINSMQLFRNGGKPQGFFGQELYILPTEIRNHARHVPVLHDFMITDIGRYPLARNHYYRRAHGSSEHILIVVQSGSGWVEIDRIVTPITAKEFVVIPADRPHAYGAVTDDPWTISWCHFVGLYGDLHVDVVKNMKGDVHQTDHKLFGRGILLFDIALDVIRRGYTVEHLVVASSLVQTLLSLLIYDNAEYGHHSERQRNFYLEQAISFIGDRIPDKLPISSIAQHIGISTSRLTQLFREHLGISPARFVVRERVYRACHYLTATDLPVAEIAEIVGYKDALHFSRVFRRTIGASPRQYRRGDHGPAPVGAEPQIPSSRDDSET